jgi:hypothetical protein
MIADPNDLDPESPADPPLPPPQPWERQPDESAQAFRAFCHYRDQGVGRSLQGAYASTRPPGSLKPGVCSGRWRGWFRGHNWRKRAEAYDRFLDEEKQRAVVRAVRYEGQLWNERGSQQRQKAWDLSQILMEQARYLAQMPVLRQTVSADGRVTVWEAIEPKAASAAAKIARVANELAMSAVLDAVRVVKELADAPDDPEEMRANIQEATRELVEWQQQMLQRASSSLSALGLPPGSSTGTG